jgi:hypothetical protein
MSEHDFAQEGRGQKRSKGQYGGDYIERCEHVSSFSIGL